MNIGYKKLVVWQKAHVFAMVVYSKTKGFPKEEMFGITSQLRRAALSVPTNIVEGYGRQGRKEFKRFLNIALGSLAETEYLLDFSFELCLFTREGHAELQHLRHEVGCRLWKLYNTL